MTLQNLEYMNLAQLDSLIKKKEDDLLVLKQYREQRVNPEIIINVVQASGRSMPISVRIKTKIHDLAQQIRVRLEARPPDGTSMSLIYSRTELDWPKTLEDYGILGGETISVVLHSRQVETEDMTEAMKERERLHARVDALEQDAARRSRVVREMVADFMARGQFLAPVQ